MMIDHGELVPYFQTQPPWITCQLSVARYHHAWWACCPSRTHLGHEGSGATGVQYGWCHSKSPEVPAMSKAIVLQCFFFGSWSKWSEMARTPNLHLGLPKNKVPLNPVVIFTLTVIISFKSNRNQWVSWIFRSKSLFAKQPYFFGPFWFSHVRDLQSIVDPGTNSESISNRLSLIKSSRWRIFGNFKVD
jgi:hypothetical protein